MKNLLLIMLLITTAQVYSQAPHLINYQGVARDNQNGLIDDQNIGLKILILSGSSSGPVVYSETHNLITNSFGLFNIMIGNGTLVSGNFAGIDWGSNTYFLRIEMDAAGGNNYQVMGTSQLVSVPYALHAKTAESVTGAPPALWRSDTQTYPGVITLRPDAGVMNNSLNGGNYFIEIGDENQGNTASNQLQLRNGIFSTFDDQNYFYSEFNTNGLFILQNGLASTDQGISMSAQNTSPYINMTTGDGAPNINLSSQNALPHIGLSGYDQNSGLLSNLALSGSDISIVDNNNVLSLHSTEIYISDLANQSNTIIYPFAYIMNYAGSSRIYADAYYSGGYINLFNSNNLGAFILTDDSFGGISGTKGPNGSDNALLTSLQGYPDNGFVAVSDQAGTLQAGIYVNSGGQGVVFGDVKNFVMDHPLQPGKQIWYASVEGPEAAAYERGTATLVSGEAFIPYSETFSVILSQQNVTVQLTPLSADSRGLAVTEKTQEGFRVKELMNGNGNYAFDWEVKAIRKGYEDYRVVRDKEELNYTLPDNKKTNRK